MAENTLSKSYYKSLATILTTWQGFNKVRRVNDLSITYSYCLLGCLLTEAQGIKITKGYIRRLMIMYNSYVVGKAFIYLLGKNYIVSAGQSGRIKYYSLTSSGRSLALDLLAGCEASQVAFFNKFPLSF